MKTLRPLFPIAATLLLLTVSVGCMTEERVNLNYYEYHNNSGQDITLDAFILFQNSLIIAQETHEIENGGKYVEYTDKQGGVNSPGITVHKSDCIRLTFPDGSMVQYFRQNEHGNEFPSIFDSANFQLKSDNNNNTKHIYKITNDHYMLARSLSGQ